MIIHVIMYILMFKEVFLQSCSAQQQEARLSAFPDPFYALVPAQVIGSEDDVQRLGRQFDKDAAADIAAKTEPSLRNGLQKQYDLLKQWFNDKTQPVAQSVY